MGRTAEEIGEILSHVPASLRERTGYGLDTCHLFASGHDITMSEDAVRVVLDQFEADDGRDAELLSPQRQRGRARLEQGSSRADRRREDWRRAISMAARRPRTRGIPLILETPQENFDIGEDDDTPDPYDVRMIEAAREAVGYQLTAISSKSDREALPRERRVRGFSADS